MLESWSWESYPIITFVKDRLGVMVQNTVCAKVPTYTDSIKLFFLLLSLLAQRYVLTRIQKKQQQQKTAQHP